ncbi:damage-inducible protein DinB [Sphingobacteriaceae bacterium]|nr:damage-inducible protein DinB [Sphingobacteriaceae bacterium]
MRPEKGTYPEYYGQYIPLVNQEDVNLALTRNWEDLQNFISSIPKEMEDYAYAPGKWTIKQVIMHLVDTERIFAYRALRFARRDAQQPLSFEENDYAANAELSERTLEDILQEFETVRKATLSLFKGFSPGTLLNAGNTAIGKTTVLAIGFLTCGHAIHHMNVIKDRYLKK